MEKLKEYIKSSYDEVVNEVTWPTYTELQKSTVAVLVGSLVFSLVVFGIDNLFDKVLSYIY